MKTSFIIPFKNEVDYAEKTITILRTHLLGESIDFELIAVDDSTDGTWELLQSLKEKNADLVVVKGSNPSGYGKALKKGFSIATGEIVLPFNGDLSDSPKDAVSYIKLMEQGYDMVLGSRFLSDMNFAEPMTFKMLISRLGNRFLQMLFRADCSDVTNSFKAYRKEIIRKIDPSADGYHISMEIALTGIKRGYSYKTIPIGWKARKYGVSKMSIVKTMPEYLLKAIRIKLFN